MIVAPNQMSIFLFNLARTIELNTLLTGYYPEKKKGTSRERERECGPLIHIPVYYSGPSPLGYYDRL